LWELTLEKKVIGSQMNSKVLPTNQTNLRLRSITFNDVVLFCIFFIYEDYACLISYDIILPMGLRPSDLGVLLAIAWSVYVFLRVRGQRHSRVYVIIPFVFAFISTVASALQAFLVLGQPLLWGILPFRRMYAAMLFAIAIVYALRSGIVSRDNLIKTLYLVAIVELCLYTLQALLASSISFLAVSTSEVRFGMARLRVPFLLPMLMGIYSFHTYLDSWHKDNVRVVLHLFFAIWTVLFVALICQHRAPTIILLLSYLVAILISRGSASTKVLATLAALLLAVGIAATPMIQSSLQALGGDTSSASQNSLTIRADGHEYYLERLQSSPVFGYGWPNSNYLPATTAAGETYKYYTVDNGIFGLAYMLGIVGCVWIAILYAGALRRSWLVRHSVGGWLFQYFLFETGNLYMGLHWFYYYPMPFMIALAILDYDYGETLHGRR
jgi:uncharacterized protein (UPF0333 family)